MYNHTPLRWAYETASTTQWYDTPSCNHVLSLAVGGSIERWRCNGVRQSTRPDELAPPPEVPGGEKVGNVRLAMRAEEV